MSMAMWSEMEVHLGLCWISPCKSPREIRDGARWPKQDANDQFLWPIEPVFRASRPPYP